MWHSSLHRVTGLPRLWQWKRTRLPVQETWIQSLGREDPLEEGMASHSSILAWRIRMDRGAWWATVHGISKSQTQLKRLTTHSGEQARHSPCSDETQIPVEGGGRNQQCAQMVGATLDWEIKEVSLKEVTFWLFSNLVFLF